MQTEPKIIWSPLSHDGATIDATAGRLSLHFEANILRDPLLAKIDATPGTLQLLARLRAELLTDGAIREHLGAFLSARTTNLGSGEQPWDGLKRAEGNHERSRFRAEGAAVQIVRRLIEEQKGRTAAAVLQEFAKENQEALAGLALLVRLEQLRVIFHHGSAAQDVGRELLAALKSR